MITNMLMLMLFTAVGGLKSPVLTLAGVALFVGMSPWEPKGHGFSFGWDT